MVKKNVGIILAGGSGVRFKRSPPKQFATIGDATILEHTLRVFENNKGIDEIIVVITPQQYRLGEQILGKNKFKKINSLIQGGQTRQESSKIGVFACNSRCTNKVLIHDAIRPLLGQKIINDCLAALDEFSAVDVAIPIADTIIKVGPDNTILEIPDRNLFRRGQTPQGFKYQVIKKAHALASRENFTDVTDDCGLVLKYKLGKIFVVEGDIENVKITYPSDLKVASLILNQQKL